MSSSANQAPLCSSPYCDCEFLGALTHFLFFSNGIHVFFACFSEHMISGLAEPTWPRPLEADGRGHGQDFRTCFHLPVREGSSLVHHVAALQMAFNAAAAAAGALGRALRSGAAATPPLLRPPKVNPLSASCRLSGGNQQQREVAKSCESCSDGPGEAANRCPPADTKRTKEPPGAPGVRGERRRSFTSAAPADTKSYMWARYNDTKRLVHELIPPGACNLLNPSTIYANNEVCLAEVDIYGFDYDYTLALYSNALNAMIFNKARSFLIEHFKYPEGIRKYDYIPNFTVRGLHYDIQKGLLMKIDAFHYIQSGTVYRGLKPLPDEEVLQLYGGTFHIPLQQDSGFYGKGPKVKQFMDIFSIPEMTLLAVANDYFITNDIEYDPVHLFKDVSEAIGMVHLKGYMYKWIMEDLDKFIQRGEETYAVLQRLVSLGKKLFLITNSPFGFVDKGMTHMVGKNWRDFFDVIIVHADKPHFFTDCVKPFRQLDSNGDLRWEKISSLDKGHIYKQGNLFDFLRLTGWRGAKVLYFGDHLYSDLADLMLRHGWRTAAIVPELEQETNVVSTHRYSVNLTWLQALTGLMERLQRFQDSESKMIFHEWQKEREELRVMMKNLFNPQFGSIFRTCHNPTYFSRRLCRFSDIYMTSVSCLLNYDPSYTFYPRRTPLQHEAPLWMDQLCTGCLKIPHLEEMSHIR